MWMLKLNPRAHEKEKMKIKNLGNLRKPIELIATRN